MYVENVHTRHVTEVNGEANVVEYRQAHECTDADRPRCTAHGLPTQRCPLSCYRCLERAVIEAHRVSVSEV